MSELGAALKAAREAANVSLARMAQRVSYAKPYLSQLENGHRSVLAEHVTAYSRALGVPVESFYGTPDDPLRVAHEWLVSDTPARVHSSAGRRVGEGLADRLETRVIELRHLDDVLGGNDLSPLVSRELASVRSVVNEASYTAATGRRLLTVLGELSQLAGWVASDAGRHAEARYVYLSGLSLARQAGARVSSDRVSARLSEVDRTLTRAAGAR